MDAIYLTGNSQQSISISGTAAQSSALDGGFYDVWADIECFLKIDEDAISVTPTNGYQLFSGNMITLHIDETHKLGVITSGQTGTLKFHRVG